MRFSAQVSGIRREIDRCMYQRGTSRVKNIIRTLKAKELERDFPHRFLGGLTKWEETRIFRTEGCGTHKSKTNPKA